MRIAVLLLALLLSGCANFQWPEWLGGKASASESRKRAPQPAPAPAAPAATPATDPVEAQQPAPSGPVEPTVLPRKRKYEED